MTRENLKISAWFMIALVIAMLMCFAGLFSSCGSHRSSLKQDASIETNIASQRKDTTSTDKQVKKTEVGKETEDSESYEVNYDTDKPVDPTTGKPPVKSEKWTGTQKTSEQNKQEIINEKTNESSTEASSTQNKENNKLESNEQKDEPTTIKQIGWAGAGIALLIIACIAAWLVYKKNKKKKK